MPSRLAHAKTLVCHDDPVHAVVVTRTLGIRRYTSFLLALFLLFLDPAYTQTLPAGDVAPYLNPDGVLNAADYLVLQRMVMGDLPTPTGDDFLVADVAPVGAPDSQLNAGDLVVLQRAINGLVTLPDIITAENISGTLTQDTTFPQGSTYIVTGTVTVSAGVTLTIEAGARVEFSGLYKLQVNGTLLVQGTQFNPVVFTSDNTINPQPGDWDGIELDAGGTGSSIDHAIIEYAKGIYINGAHATNITNSQIRNFSQYGIYYSSFLSGLISGNTIENGGANSIGIRASSNQVTVSNNTISNTESGIVSNGSYHPSILGNTVQNNTTNGIYITDTATPVISGNTIVANQYGIYAQGTSVGVPAPVVTGNSIYNNTARNYYAWYFVAGVQNEDVMLDATGNWWGSVDPATIASKIYDYKNDTTYSPFVNFTGFLDGPGGSPVPGNQLVGVIQSNTTITSGSNYAILSLLRIPPGVTLTVEGGARLEFEQDSRLDVNGILSVQGSASNAAIFTSAEIDYPHPQQGDWKGIRFPTGSSGSVIDHAVIEWVTDGITAFGAGTNVVVTNSTVRGFTSRGIFYYSGATGQVTGSTVDNVNNPGTGSGIEITSSAALPVLNNTVRNSGFGISIGASAATTVSGNTLQNNQNGIRITDDASPQVTANTITNNVIGVLVDDDLVGTGPLPSVTGNNIFNNTNYNFRAQEYAGAINQDVMLDATGNWWGTTDPATIANTIYDYSDDPVNSPFVDFRGFLDGAGGFPVAGAQLAGKIPPNTTLTSGTDYTILSTLWVGAGDTLTIEGGVTLDFVNNAMLQVDGTLLVNGTIGNEVTFTSANTVPSRGDWTGIYLSATSTGSSISHAMIEWVTRGVEVAGANVTVSDSVVREFSEYGMYYGAGSSGTIGNNTIDNVDDQGVGIFIDTAGALSVVGNVISNTDIAIQVVGDATCTINGNSLQDNNNGLWIAGSADPQVTGNAILNNNAYGVYISGTGNDATNPQPVITANDIYNNSLANLLITNYGASSSIIIDATGNWWGTDVLAQIQATIVIQSAQIDFSGFTSGPAYGPVVTAMNVSELYFSPNGDTVKDVTLLQATLSEAADWTLSVQDASTVVVRTYTGTGTVISQVWDGADDLAQPVPEGDYRFVLVASVGARTSLPFISPTVVLDTTPPIADIDNALDGTLLQNVLDLHIQGAANDPAFSDYQVEYGAGAAPTAWNPISGVLAIPVITGELDHWTIGYTDGTTPSIANGLYTLRVTVSDKAGNTATDSAQVTVDNLTIGAVSHTVNQVDISNGESVGVDFTLNIPGTVTLKIYRESEGVSGIPLRTLSQLYSNPGSYTLTWDGLDDLLNPVSDGAYLFVLEGSDGVRTGVYSPVNQTGPVTIPSDNYQLFNSFKNERWSYDITLTEPGRVVLEISTSGLAGAPLFYPHGAGISFDVGTHAVTWDGRLPNGDRYIGTFGVKISEYIYPDNTVVVTGNPIAPVVSGVAPTVEVQSDPYLIYLSYGQFTTIAYTLNTAIGQSADVDIRILPPGILDFDDPGTVVIYQGNQMPGVHQVTWDGIDSNDPSGKGLTSPDDGTYTFAIKATNSGGGPSSLYRGVVNVYQ